MANQKEAKGNGFKNFLLFIVIPGAFLVVIGALFLSAVEMSPMEQASTWIGEEEDDGEEEASLTEKDEEIANLEAQLQQAEDTIEELEEEIEQMEEDEAYAEASTEELEDGDGPEALTRIARVYENMRPGQAAEIMEELTNDTILLHMSEMNDDSRSVILENMDPERAAEITNLLAN